MRSTFFRLKTNYLVEPFCFELFGTFPNTEYIKKNTRQGSSLIWQAIRNQMRPDIFIMKCVPF